MLLNIIAQKIPMRKCYFLSSRNCDIEEESVFGMFVSATCECPENISIIFAVKSTRMNPL